MQRLWCVLLLAVLRCSSVNSKNVPVLIWNNHQSADREVPSVASLEEVSVATLQSRYLHAFQPDNILLFLQDSLSVEDLSSHPAELANVSGLFGAARSVFLPAVTRPAGLRHELLRQGYKPLNISAGSAVAELKLEEGRRHLVEVRLPPTQTNPSRRAALRKSGEVMAGVLGKIGEAADFTIIYTALQPSVQPSSPPRMRVARSLSQVKIGEALPPNFHHTPCVFVYLRRNLTFSLSGAPGSFVPLPESTVTEPIAHCPPPHSSAGIGLKYNNVNIDGKLFHRITVTLHFKRDHSGWWAPYADIAVVEKAETNPTTRLYIHKQAYGGLVPLSHSLTCGETLAFRAKPGEGQGRMTLRVNGIQVQAFMTGQTQFGPSWDCVGFFTPGIWMGLLSGGLALVILAYGMAMIQAITPMDRFDDPKAKSVVVVAAEEH